MKTMMKAFRLVIAAVMLLSFALLPGAIAEDDVKTITLNVTNTPVRGDVMLEKTGLQLTGFSEEQALKYYRHDLETIVAEAINKGSRVILTEPFIFPRPSEYIHWEPCVMHFCAQVRDIAVKNGACLIAPKEHFGIAASRSHLGWGQVTTDGIHLTDEGHRILAALWRDTFFAKMN